MSSDISVVEVQSFSRRGLIRALELELSIQSKGRLAPSFQDVKQFTIQFLDKTSGHVPYAQLLLVRFPEVALALGALGVVKAFSGYADYSSNADSMFHALRILVFATDDQISEIDLLVVGGLYRFVNEKIIQPFEARLIALKELVDIDLSQRNIILERIAVYNGGLIEVNELAEILRDRVRILESQRDAVKFRIEQEKRQAKQIYETELNRLELSYKSGLISQEEYSNGKLNLTLVDVGNSISGTTKQTMLSLKNNLTNDKLVSYSNSFFGEVYDPIREEVEIRKKENKQTIFGIIIMIIVLFILFSLFVILVVG